MKAKNLLIALIALGTATYTFAEESSADEKKDCPKCEKRRGRGPKGERGNPGERLTKALNLTADQQAKVKAIFDEAQKERKAKMEANREKFKAAKESGEKPDHEKMKAHREAMMKEMKAKRDEVNGKIEAILTAEQKTKFTEIKAKMKERMEARGKEGKGAPKGRPGRGRGKEKSE